MIYIYNVGLTPKRPWCMACFSWPFFPSTNGGMVMLLSIPSAHWDPHGNAGKSILLLVESHENVVQMHPQNELAGFSTSIDWCLHLWGHWFEGQFTLHETTRFLPSWHWPSSWPGSSVAGAACAPVALAMEYGMKHDNSQHKWTSHSNHTWLWQWRNHDICHDNPRINHDSPNTIHCKFVDSRFLMIFGQAQCSKQFQAEGRLVRQAVDVADALAIQHAQGQGSQESGTIPAMAATLSPVFPQFSHLRSIHRCNPRWAQTDEAKQTWEVKTSGATRTNPREANQWGSLRSSIPLAIIIYTLIIFFRGLHRLRFPQENCGWPFGEKLELQPRHVRLIRLINVAKSIKPGKNKKIQNGLPGLPGLTLKQMILAAYFSIFLNAFWLVTFQWFLTESSYNT